MVDEDTRIWCHHLMDEFFIVCVNAMKKPTMLPLYRFKDIIFRINLNFLKPLLENIIQQNVGSKLNEASMSFVLKGLSKILTIITLI